MALTHNSTLAKTEPKWGTVDKTLLSRNAHARMGDPDKKASWGFPHHHIVGGKTGGPHGVYVSGTMYLHKGGLRAALSAAGGARSGKKAESAVHAHLTRHSNAIGMGKKETASLLGISISEINNILNLTGGEKNMAMDFEQMEARIKELEALLAQKDEDGVVAGLNARIEAMQADYDSMVAENETTIVDLTTKIEGLEADTHFVEIGKDTIATAKDNIAKIQAQVDGEDFNKELLDKQIEALGDDWDSLKMFQEGLEKRRAKLFKTGEINPDKSGSAASDEVKEQEEYELGQKIGAAANVIPLRT